MEIFSFALFITSIMLDELITVNISQYSESSKSDALALLFANFEICEFWLYYICISCTDVTVFCLYV